MSCRRFGLARAASLVLLTALLVACGDFQPGFKLWQANRRFAAGRSHEALVEYLSLSDTAAAAHANYNIATIYLQMGESEAAFRLLSAVTGGQDDSLASLAWHNLGVLWFRQTDYDQALRAFRSALTLVPGRTATIIAYEATLERLHKSRSSSSDRERAAMQSGAGDSFGLFSLSSSSAKDLFKSGGVDDDATILDH